jgi:mannose-1-phosphate guanylyltransferase
LKAVILVGGEGTRLRPLSFNRPKPMMPVANRPFIEYILQLLERHSIKDIILSTCYLPEILEQGLKDGSHLGVKLTYVVEEAPLGTAGAVKNVEDLLEDTFLVLNGDVLTDLDLTSVIQYHRGKKSKVTIALTPVEDPTLYGLVELREDGSIIRFLEKPSWDQITSNLINAGTYVIEPEVLSYAPQGENYSFERGLFPSLLREKVPLFGYVSDAYWLDIGTPTKYLLAHRDLLEGRIEHQFESKEIGCGLWVGEGTEIDPQAKVANPVLIGKNCHIKKGAKIAGLTVIGNNCVVETGAFLEGSVLLDDCIVGKNSVVENSILGQGVRLSERVHVSDEAVLGDNCTVEEENHLRRGIKVWPSTLLKRETIKF